MGGLPAEKRPVMGKLANEVRTLIQEQMEERRRDLRKALGIQVKERDNRCDYPRKKVERAFILLLLCAMKYRIYYRYGLWKLWKARM